MILYKPDNLSMTPEQVCGRALAIATAAQEDVTLQFKSIEFVVHHSPVQFVLNLYHQHRSTRDWAAANKTLPGPEQIRGEGLT